MKGCNHSATLPIPRGYVGDLLQFGHNKHNVLCDAHYRAVLRATKVPSLPLPHFCPHLKTKPYLQQAHNHDHDVVKSADAMDVDPRGSEQHPTSHPLKPFNDLGGYQQWTRVNKFARSIWETIVDSAMDVLHCKSFDLNKIEFSVDGEAYAIDFSHQHHPISHLATLSEEERSQVFMVSVFLFGQIKVSIVNKVNPPDLAI